MISLALAWIFTTAMKQKDVEIRFTPVYVFITGFMDVLMALAISDAFNN